MSETSQEKADPKSQLLEYANLASSALPTNVKRNFHYKDSRLAPEELATYLASFPLKFAWFLSRKYKPHYYQAIFHALQDDDERLLRFRHLVAGRRGGKTLSAAWDTAFYCIFPSEFHWDAHKTKADEPLYCWALYKDNPTGLAAWTTFRNVMQRSGLEYGKDYKEHKGNRWFEFENGSFVHFRTAEDPESLRGAGLDIMWIDEAAFIPNERAWEVASPALADKEGIVYTTTTPQGKNWFWSEFFSEKAQEQEWQGRVEYRSIDNPYFPREEWKRYLRSYHPLQFKQEFMAAFDALAGRELHGDWLKYYTLKREPDGDKPPIPRNPANPEKYDLTLYMGVDPAISLAEKADRFAMSLVGIQEKTGNAFLIKQYVGKIPFPEQLDKIQEWHTQYRPSIIAIEANAYQAALEQQVARLPGLPNTIPIISREKKFERILAMAPLFRTGRVRILEEHRDFIDEWLNYDSTIKNPEDDALDSVEIALRAAGALLPRMPKVGLFEEEKPASTVEEWVRRDMPGSIWSKGTENYDPTMGADW